MTIREYVKTTDIEIVGKLKRAPHQEVSKNWRSYVDEKGTVFEKNIKTGAIVITGEDEDGIVWVL